MLSAASLYESTISFLTCDQVHRLYIHLNRKYEIKNNKTNKINISHCYERREKYQLSIHLQKLLIVFQRNDLHQRPFVSTKGGIIYFIIVMDKTICMFVSLPELYQRQSQAHLLLFLQSRIWRPN